jgi:hypothetical protein
MSSVGEITTTQDIGTFYDAINFFLTYFKLTGYFRPALKRLATGDVLIYAVEKKMGEP